MADPIRVTVWNENRHEQWNEVVQAVYPDGIHNAIAGFLADGETIAVRTATLDDPEHGLTEEVLSEPDVLVWWGHIAHDEVSDAVVDRVQARVLEGMGLIALHSAHYSRIFRRLLGTSCWERGHGRMFYFRPGHETYPTYRNATVQQVIRNGVTWARPRGPRREPAKGKRPPLEPLGES